jgi:hypothetical protein
MWHSLSFVSKYETFETARQEFPVGWATPFHRCAVNLPDESGSFDKQWTGSEGEQR